MVRKPLVAATAAVLPIALLLALMEAFLRLQPSVISVAFLSSFPPSLAAEIAGRLGLDTSSNYRRITTEMRGDGGREYLVNRPNSRHLRPADAVDLAYGISEIIETDDLGYCNPRGRPPGAPVDVLVLSGSIPGCIGVAADQTVSAELGRALGRNVYNMSIGGVGPAEYLDVLRRDGVAVEPKTVLMIISENDLRDMIIHNNARQGKYKNNKKRDLDNSVFAYSYLLSFLRSGFKSLKRAFKAAGEPEFRYRVQTMDGPVALNVLNNDTDELGIARTLAAGEITLSLFRPPLEEFVALSKQHGFRPLVTVAPSAYSAYLNSIEFSDPAVADVMKSFGETGRKWLADMASVIGYDFVDAIPAIQNAAAGEKLLYFPANVHLTPDGNRVLASALAPLIAPLL